MVLMIADKKPKPKFPSREKVKYVPIPKEMWAELETMGEADERSVSYMVRKAIRFFLDSPKKPKKNGAGD